MILVDCTVSERHLLWRPTQVARERIATPFCLVRLQGPPPPSAGFCLWKATRWDPILNIEYALLRFVGLPLQALVVGGRRAKRLRVVGGWRSVPKICGT